MVLRERDRARHGVSSVFILFFRGTKRSKLSWIFFPLLKEKSVGETRRYLKKRGPTYPLACFRSSSPSSVKSFCKSSTSMPSSPSARSRAIAAEILVLFVARARRGRCFRDADDDFIVEPSGRPLLREHNAKSSLNPNPNPRGASNSSQWRKQKHRRICGAIPSPARRRAGKRPGSKKAVRWFVRFFFFFFLVDQKNPFFLRRRHFF